MKTILILLVALVSSINISAQITTDSYVDIGFTNWSKTMYKYKDFWRDKSAPVSFYTSLVFKASYKRFSITNKLDTYMDKSKADYTFVPLSTTYNIRAEIKYKYGIIGIEHVCVHPIITSPLKDDMTVYRASHDKVFIRIKF